MSDAASLPEGWCSNVLIGLADYHNGVAFKPNDWVEDGLPIIRIERINDPNSDTDRFAGPLHPSNFVDTGDLIFSWSATLKAVIWQQGPGALNQHLYKVVPKPGIHRQFLLYVLDQNMERLAARSQGSTMRHVTRRELSRFRVVYPRSESHQRRLAAVLGSIDQAIENTEALIGKYQRIKAGLMHDLFTRGIGPDGKLRPPREQAPELYQQSPIGWIPVQWDQQPLSFGLSSSPKNGYSPREADEWEGLYVLGLGCLTKAGFRPFQLKNAPRRAAASGATLQDGDFLISRSNTSDAVGLCGVYRDIGHPAIYPDLMIRLKLKSKLDREFLERYLLSDAVRLRISAIAVGTSGSMLKINAKTLSDLNIAFPPLGEQRLLVEKARPIEKQLAALKEQFEKLQAKKAGLMHDLLTGKVPVNPDPPEPADD
jgi:type I restriction enzyme S subunit